MLLVVCQHCLFVVARCMKVMGMCQVGVMRGLFVVACLVVLGRLFVMLRGKFMMFGRMFMMLVDFGHGGFLLLCRR